MTLWSLPAQLEDQLQEHWQTWLDEADRWAAVFERVQGQSGSDLLASLDELGILSDQQRDTIAELKRSRDDRAVPLPGSHTPSDDIITLLAAGFSRGEPGAPAIPYARLKE